MVMYPLMLAMPITGIAMGYFGGSGVPLFGLRIPGKKDTKDEDKEIAKQAVDYHKLLGSVFELLVPLHVAAAGLHLAFSGENAFTRMATPGMMDAAGKVAQAVRTRPLNVATGAGVLLAVVALCPADHVAVLLQRSLVRLYTGSVALSTIS